ncbi:MAG: response regulator [Chloroflexota bacterium]
MPNVRIFLVDNYPVVRYGLRQALQAERGLCVVGEAENGEAACAHLAVQPADVLVIDVCLGGMSGVEVVRWVRTRQPAMKVLILAGCRDEDCQRQAGEAGADRYLPKNASLEEIIHTIRSIAGGTSPDTSPAHNGSSDRLSGRELEVLALAGKGFTNKEIARQLSISDRTVQTHLTRIYHKIQVASRTEAVLYALAHGWMTAMDYEI